MRSHSRSPTPWAIVPSARSRSPKTESVLLSSRISRATTYASGAERFAHRTNRSPSVVVTETVSGTVASVTVDGLGNYSAVLPLVKRLQRLHRHRDRRGWQYGIGFVYRRSGQRRSGRRSLGPSGRRLRRRIRSSIGDDRFQRRRYGFRRNDLHRNRFRRTRSLLGFDGIAQNATNVFSSPRPYFSGCTGTASVSTVEYSVANTLLVSTLPVTVNAANLTVTGMTKPNASVTASGGAAHAHGRFGFARGFGTSAFRSFRIASDLYLRPFDALGNTASGTLVITEDSINPVVTLSTASSTTYALTVPVAGTTEPFATVTVTGDPVRPPSSPTRSAPSVRTSI